MGEEKREKIYATFEDLLKEHKPLFKFFGGKKQRGIYKAIWDSRKGEIDGLREEIRRLKEELAGEREKSKGYEDMLIFQEDKIVEFEEQLPLLEREKKNLSDKCGKLKKFGTDLERGLMIHRGRLADADGEIRKLSEDLDKTSGERKKALGENRNLKKYLGEKERSAEVVRKELEEAKAYIRTQRRLNGKMAARLLKTEEELERLRYRRDKAEYL